MGDVEFVEQIIQTTREYRDRALKAIEESGLSDLSFRPSTGMSSLGWLLAHQAAVYDFSLNSLLLGQSPSRPDLFQKYIPGTSGDWDGTTLEEIHAYFNAGEQAFIDWIKNQTKSDLELVIDRENIPKFFRGMTIREILTNLFAHLNRHTGHLESLGRDWVARKDHQI